MEENVMPAKEQGFESGYEKGIEKEKLQIVKNMLAENTPPDYITKVTGLSMEELRALQAESIDKIH